MKCLDEGTLQAYLDNELTEDRMARAAGHLAVCEGCHERLGRREASLGRVKAWLDTLSPEAPLERGEGIRRIAPKRSGVRWRWVAAGFAGAAAAAIPLFFAGAPSIKPERTPARKIEDPRIAVAAAPVAPEPARTATVRKRPDVRHRKEAPPNDFIAFDDADPIQIGMVVRVMLPVTDAYLTGGPPEAAAEVVIGEDGRPRAFRFLQ